MHLAASAYRGTGREHDSVKHSAGEYVKYLAGATVHTNGVESLWSMLKRAHKGVYHRLSPEAPAAGTWTCSRDGRTSGNWTRWLRFRPWFMGMVGRRLMYRDLTAETGRSPVAS